MHRLGIATFALLSFAGCAPEEELLDGPGPSGIVADEKIYGGEAPDQPFHEAVVGIHERTKRGVYTQPFCTGTLIGEDWILTAAHCVVDSRGRAKRASTFAIYVGDDPASDSDIWSHLYYVDSVQVHASYNRSTLRNDIALLHLSTPVTEVDAVPYLPSSLALGSADIGADLNHAGFGYDETRDYGVKLQADVPLAGFGCVVSGCSSAGDPATQISYSQAYGGGLGPCNGDSGGPAFVTRGTTTYVAGITSYGDSYCTIYGVSTKVDAYASWIGARTGL